MLSLFLKVCRSAGGVLFEEAKENMLKSMGITRFGKPEEVAELVAYLLSPMAHWMTGSAVRIDGGVVQRI